MDRYQLRAVLTNDSAVPAECAVIYLDLDSRLELVATPEGFQRQRETIETNDPNRHVVALTKSWSVPPNLPIFQEQPFDLVRLVVDVPSEGVPTRYALGWEIRAPKMGVRKGFTWLEVAAWIPAAYGRSKNRWRAANLAQSRMDVNGGGDVGLAGRERDEQL